MIPPPLSDDELSAILDGIFDDQVQIHLENCESCTARLDKMQKLEKTLQQRLNRFECPSSVQLGEFYLQMLKADEIQRIAQHVEGCPRCQNEISTLIHFLDDSQESPRKKAEIIRVPANYWIVESIETVGNLALRTLRGSNESHSHDVKVNTANFYLETSVTDQKLHLTGQVIDSDVNWIGAVAEIWQNDLPQHICILDEMCEFKAELNRPDPVTLYITTTTEITVLIKKITHEN